MTARLGAALTTLILMTGCTKMKASDFKESTPAPLQLGPRAQWRGAKPSEGTLRCGASSSARSFSSARRRRAF